jgi:hypothetical protein
MPSWCLVLPRRGSGSSWKPPSLCPLRGNAPSSPSSPSPGNSRTSAQSSAEASVVGRVCPIPFLNPSSPSPWFPSSRRGGHACASTSPCLTTQRGSPSNTTSSPLRNRGTVAVQRMVQRQSPMRTKLRTPQRLWPATWGRRRETCRRPTGGTTLDRWPPRTS